MNNEEFYNDEAIEYAERPNKTALKREFQSLQDLAIQIIALPDEKINQFPLSENTIASIQQTERIKSKNALRRHIRYLAKQLAKEDISEIQAYFNKVEEQQTRNSTFFHQLESWRDRLIEQQSGIFEEVLAEYPNLDRQYLRNLIRQANKETKNNQAPKSSRKIFKYLREISEQ